MRDTKGTNERSIKKTRYFKKLRDFAVQCELCPRRCKIDRNMAGFCGTRKNFDGELFSLNYGVSTYMVVEPIETNAVFHYYPGENALALGSIGCNLDCSFCQAWQYSKLKNIGKMDFKWFHFYTPEEVVSKALELDLSIISWTFNDPMSWFEFVLDTSKLAKENGITCLFKSNHYINETPLKALAQWVDLFSISIKSMEDEFYQKYCFGSLEPVLAAAKILKKLNKHIEICYLVIPTLNNGKRHFNELINWVKENLGIDTPLHFARFHPDYKLKNLSRTSLSNINQAIKLAQENGFKYVYSGNTFMDEGLNTYCVECGNLLIDRKGGKVLIINKDSELCETCKTPHHIKFLKRETKLNPPIKSAGDYLITYDWRYEVWSIHIQVRNFSNKAQFLIIKNVYLDDDHKEDQIDLSRIRIAPNEELRYTFNRINDRHKGIVIYSDKTVEVQIFENIDRAYYSLRLCNEIMKRAFITKHPNLLSKSISD